MANVEASRHEPEVSILLSGEKRMTEKLQRKSSRTITASDRSYNESRRLRSSPKRAYQVPTFDPSADRLRNSNPNFGQFQQHLDG